MKVIGITGGVGAGKSTVLAYLEKKYDACIIQADEIGHQVMEPDGRCYERVIALFGKQIIKNDKTIDRKRVSDVVFSSEEMLEKLNAIIHPAVREEILERLDMEKQNGREISVVEAALLLEERYQEFCDTVWYVHTDERIRICRLMESRGYTEQKARSIMKNQGSEAFFREQADFIIENNDDLKRTFQQIDEGVKRI